MRFGRAGVLVVFAVFVAGCPNPNTYGVPRTTPPGKVSHSLALEAFNVSAVTARSTGGRVQTERNSATFPHLPSYLLRIGLDDRVDLGLRVANLSTLGADVKWNFIRTSAFDLAVDPGVQLAYYSLNAAGTNASGSESIFLYNLHAPLLFGINAGDVTFVPSAGVMFGGTSQNVTTTTDRDATDTAIGTQTFYLRAGLGVNVRVSRGFALHPEVTVLRGFTVIEPMFVTFGVGFNFGALPRYGDDRERDEFADENDVHLKRTRRPPPQPSTPTGDPNGPPVELSPTAPPEPAPGECLTTCGADEGALTPEEHKRVAASLEPAMRTLRACLDRIGAELVEPTLLLRFAPTGQPVDIRIDVGGYEQLECIQPVRTTPINVSSSKRLLRCVYRCGK
jgi:hypothetical protein